VRDSSYGEALLSVPSGDTLTLESITIDGNDVEASEAAILVKGSLTLEDGATVQNNTRTVGADESDWIDYSDGTRYYAVGGGISVIGGSLTMNDGAIVTNNTISDSEKINDQTTDAIGGGIGIYDGSSLTINGGTISDNEATTSGAARAMGGGIGVVAHEDSANGSCTVNMAGGSVTGNTSTTLGGGIYLTTDGKNVEALIANFSDGTISSNKTAYGGGIRTYGGTVHLTGTTISNNTAAYNGGGVYFGNYTEGILNGSEISSNKATGNTTSGVCCGGSVFVYTSLSYESGEISNNEADRGAGIYAVNDLKLSAGEISENNATGYGGGVFAENTLTLSGEIEISDNTAVNRGGGVYAITVYMKDGAVVSGNSVTGSSGVGGGMFVAGYLEMSGGTIGGEDVSDGNTAYNSSGVYIGYDSTADGVNIRMTGSHISNNTADYRGGGVYLTTGSFEMTGGYISGNSVTGNNSSGGGVYIPSGNSMTLDGGSISKNTALTSGGAIAVYGGSLTISDGSIFDNRATSQYGGGIFVTGSGAVAMSGGQISGNSAVKGGAIGSYGPGTINISGGEIVYNTSTSTGGAIRLDDNNTTAATLNLTGG